jgi:hypothetical protein
MTDKEKLKEILKWCKINAKGWDPDQHDGPAEFKAICDLIEEKGYYKNDKEQESHDNNTSYKTYEKN